MDVQLRGGMRDRRMEKEDLEDIDGSVEIAATEHLLGGESCKVS